MNKLELTEQQNDVIFPTWKSLIMDIMVNRRHTNTSPIKTAEIISKLKLLDKVSQSINHFHPTQIISILSEPSGSYSAPEPINQLLNKFKMTCLAENQFYTVFDMNLGWYSIIDPKISTALGITPDEFSPKAMAGMDPENPLFHPSDVHHMIRWASLGYLLLSFPGFRWDTLKTCYYVRHRIGTKRSKNEELRKKNYVTLEKRCYPLFAEDANEILKPIFHFDQWSVLDANDFDYVRPKWVTSVDQSDDMNAIFYLLNAYLLNISTKHICILAERQQQDRNKAAANSLNRKILNGTGFNAEYDEYDISNALSKTIRSKISSCMNTWDKRTANNWLDVGGDQEAIHYAKALGLLPIPKKVEDLIYHSISIN